MRVPRTTIQMQMQMMVVVLGMVDVHLLLIQHVMTLQIVVSVFTLASYVMVQVNMEMLVGDQTVLMALMKELIVAALMTHSIQKNFVQQIVLVKYLVVL